MDLACSCYKEVRNEETENIKHRVKEYLIEYLWIPWGIKLAKHIKNIVLEEWAVIYANKIHQVSVTFEEQAILTFNFSLIRFWS